MEDENHPPMGSPIVNLLKAIDYAEVCDDCILTPNCATECEEDGTVSTDETTLDVIKYIINRDVIGYFELGEEVNSPLKLKKYKESQDYKNNLTFLNGVRSCVMNHEYFIESDLTQNLNLIAKHLSLKYLLSTNARLLQQTHIYQTMDTLQHPFLMKTLHTK